MVCQIICLNQIKQREKISSIKYVSNIFQAGLAIQMPRLHINISDDTNNSGYNSGLSKEYSFSSFLNNYNYKNV